MNDNERDIIQGKLIRQMNKIFIERIERKIPLTQEEKTFVKNTKALDNKHPFLKTVCDCFFDSDLT